MPLKLRAVLVAAALSITLAGCQQTIPKDALALKPTTLEDRTAQSRYFDTKDEDNIIAACSGVLQDLGFSIDKSETKLGFIVGSKDRDATDAGQVAGAILVAVLFGVSAPIDKTQKIRAAIITNRSFDGERTHVRVKFQRKVWNTQNQISNVETLSDPELYQEFFDKLSKSVFLEGYKI